MKRFIETVSATSLFLGIFLNGGNIALAAVLIFTALIGLLVYEGRYC